MLTTVGTGNLCADPEVYEYGEGDKAGKKVSMRIAVNHPGDRVSFLNLIVFGRTGENCAKFLSKGKKVGFSGELQIREYERKNGGGKGISPEVVCRDVEFLTPRGADEGDASFNTNELGD